MNYIAKFYSQQKFLSLLMFLVFMDFLLGITIACIFKKSLNSPNGRLESSVFIKSVARKLSYFFLVASAKIVDIFLEIDIIENATIFSLCFGELISIIENIGLMGVKIPKSLKNAIDVLKKDE